ncbi:MAG: quinone-dependent dihydroorotate dehydrogenase [Myxococcota bacterium]
MIYRFVVRPLLWLLPAETAHHVAFGLLRIAHAIPGVGALLRALFEPRDPALPVRALGLDLPSPIGLAAGFDKDARGYDALGALGFGFVEVGTLTAVEQPGNPEPRLFRLPRDRALVNRMGFNNGGAEAAARRLARPRRTVVGVNIGKTKLVPDERAVDDYVVSTEWLAPHADYFVVNVSSPNTPGLRDLQTVDKLRPLLSAVRRTLDATAPGRHVPLLVKIAPDLADEDVDAVADLAVDLGLDGVIATNTTIGRQGLASAPERVEACGPGGLSGPPLAERSLQVLRRLRARLGDRLVLVSVGGVESPAEAWRRIRAGATLVQVYTALIYEGPGLPKRLARGVAACARAEGYERVQDAVGADGRAGGADDAGSGGAL